MRKNMTQIKLQELKAKSPTELLVVAEELEVENASTLRTQELMFAILKQVTRLNVIFADQKKASGTLRLSRSIPSILLIRKKPVTKFTSTI